MIKHLTAVTLIFVFTSAAWMLLGSTVDRRSAESGRTLANKVGTIWGGAHEQTPPALFSASGLTLPLESTRIQVRLDLEPRQKGLLWFNTYTAHFDADYVFAAEKGRLLYAFPLPLARAQYDRAVVLVDGVEVPFEIADGQLRFAFEAKDPRVRITTRYTAKGQGFWQYGFGPGTGRVKDFELALRTNFAAIDFADNSLAPGKKKPIASGWELTWSSASMLSGFPVKVVMPERLQPGPLGAAISYFAPVSLFFFFFVLLIITSVRRVRLHPVNYFFLATAFFAFHLLFAYLADHLNVHATFLICSLVSTGLVVSYLRLVVNLRFAAVEAGLAQFVYLILFSYAQFFEGYAGLTVTIGAIITLFLVMQFTARVDWDRVFLPET